MTAATQPGRSSPSRAHPLALTAEQRERAMAQGLIGPASGQPARAAAPAAAASVAGGAADPALLVFLSRTGACAAGTVTNVLVSVSPAIAVAWLKTNHHNRRPSTAKIARFAAAMREGRWTLTGEPIKFDLAGELLDGQSRLRAIIQADATVLLEVRWGLPRASQESMDTGEARGHAHQLQMAGVRYSSATAAAVRMVWLWEQGSDPVGESSGTSSRMRNRITNTTIRETYERHPGITDSVQRYGSAAQGAKLLPLSRVAGYHYLFSRIDPAKATIFWDGLVTGADLSPGTPVHQLRERLVADRLSQSRIGGREQAALVIKAWNAFYHGERLHRLAYRFKGDDPEAFPKIAGDPRDTEPTQRRAEGPEVA